MSYRIASFNLRNLGFTALGKANERDLKKIAEIINKEKFDVVALQEVLSEGKAFTSNIESEHIKRGILMELGGHWEFEWCRVSNEPSDKRNEGFAFLWNSDRLRMPTIETSDGKIRMFYPQKCELNKDELTRQPYYARLTPAGTPIGGPNVEFRLICIHTFFGDDKRVARQIRNHEIDVLIKDIYPQIADRRYGMYGNGMPSYTIMLGDYNVILARPWKDLVLKEINSERRKQGKSPLKKPAVLLADANDIIETTRWGNRRIKTVQHEFTTLRDIEPNDQDKAINERGYVNDYDHFSYEVSRFEGIKFKAKRIDAVRKYCNDDFGKYWKEVSDHIPIVMEVELNNLNEVE